MEQASDDERVAELSSEVEFLRAQVADVSGAWQMSMDACDRFRDVICQALGLSRNPGDSELVYQLLLAHGKADEPESTRWRDFLTAQLERLR